MTRLLTILLLACFGCAQPKTAQNPPPLPQAKASVVVTPPRWVEIGIWGTCKVISNTVSRLVITNCPAVALLKTNMLLGWDYDTNAAPTTNQWWIQVCTRFGIWTNYYKIDGKTNRLWVPTSGGNGNFRLVKQ